MPEAVHENLPTPSSAVKVSARINLLQAVQFIGLSWPTVSTKTILNCLAHCGIKHSCLVRPNKEDSENYVMLEMHHVGSYEEFSCIDNGLQCYHENEDCEEAAVEQTAMKHQETSEDRETDEDDTTQRERVTHQDARKCTAGQ
jgi:hypothetical protein